MLEVVEGLSLAPQPMDGGKQIAAFGLDLLAADGSKGVFVFAVSELVEVLVDWFGLRDHAEFYCVTIITHKFIDHTVYSYS